MLTGALPQLGENVWGEGGRRGEGRSSRNTLGTTVADRRTAVA